MSEGKTIRDFVLRYRYIVTGKESAKAEVESFDKSLDSQKTKTKEASKSMSYLRGEHKRLAEEIASGKITLDEYKKSLDRIKRNNDKVAQSLKKSKEAAKKARKEGFNKLKSSLNDFAGVADRVFARLAQLGAGLAALTVVTATNVAEQATMAKQYGLTITEMRQLEHISIRMRVPLTTLAMSLKDQARLVDESKTRWTLFSDALTRVNLDLTDFEEKTPLERLGLIGDALNKVADPAERTALAMRLMGEESGSRLQPVVALGSQGIAEMAKEADMLGGSLADSVNPETLELADNIARLQTTLKNLVRVGVGKAAPALTRMAEQALRWVSANEDLIDQQLDVFIQNIGIGLRDALSVGRDFIDVGKRVLGIFDDWTTSIEAVIAALAVAKVAAFAVANPLSAVIALALLVGLKLGEALYKVEAGAMAAAGGISAMNVVLDDARRKTAALTEEVAQLQAQVNKQEDYLSGATRGYDEGLAGFKRETGEFVFTPEAAQIENKINTEIEVAALKAERNSIKRQRQAGATDNARILRVAKRRGNITRKSMESRKVQARHAASQEFISTGRVRTRTITKALAPPRPSGSGGKKKGKKEEPETITFFASGQEAELDKDITPANRFTYETAIGKINAEAQKKYVEVLQATNDYDKAKKAALLREQQLRKQFNEQPGTLLGESPDLIATLTGGRLSSGKFGTGQQPGFGAQVVKFDIDFRPHFETNVSAGSVQASIDDIARVVDERNSKLETETRAMVTDVLPIITLA